MAFECSRVQLNWSENYITGKHRISCQKRKKNEFAKHHKVLSTRPIMAGKIFLAFLDWQLRQACRWTCQWTIFLAVSGVEVAQEVRTTSQTSKWSRASNDLSAIFLPQILNFNKYWSSMIFISWFFTYCIRQRIHSRQILGYSLTEQGLVDLEKSVFWDSCPNRCLETSLFFYFSNASDSCYPFVELLVWGFPKWCWLDRFHPI